MEWDEIVLEGDLKKCVKKEILQHGPAGWEVTLIRRENAKKKAISKLRDTKAERDQNSWRKESKKANTAELYITRRRMVLVGIVEVDSL